MSARRLRNKVGRAIAVVVFGVAALLGLTAVASASDTGETPDDFTWGMAPDDFTWGTAPDDFTWG